METKQQNEALEYFREYALDWKRKAEENLSDIVNIIKQRNDYVLQVISERVNTALTLDVGCGTGDLVCDIAKGGVNAEGVDFAQEMIDLAKEKAAQMGLDNAHFQCASVFDYDMGTSKYDVISANGFIEYISYKQLDQFFDTVHKALTPGGSLVFGSRNRLFNLFSMNKFTLDELDEGNYALLLQEAVKIATGSDMSVLSTINTAPLQQEEHRHENTGVNVHTRYQFTPAQLVQMLDKKGFAFAGLLPAHTHGVPPAFATKHEQIHGSIANLLLRYANENMNLVPQSSSFMLHVTKK